MSTHTYDITDVNVVELVGEVNTALPSKVMRINGYNGNIDIVFDDELTAGEITTLDTAVSDHKAASSTRTLDRNKNARKDEIDSVTRRLIAAGFTYNSKVFSMSRNAQSKWHALHADRANHTYPVEVLTMDESAEESLANAAAVEAFYTAMVTEVRGHIDSGAGLKKSIRDATTQFDVDAVVDNR